VFQMYFDWKDSFKVDVAEIDRQHMKLFDIGGRISDLVMADDGYDHYDEIVLIFEELKNYAIYHFNYEEQLLEQHGYKDLDTQKIQHMFFIKKLEKIQKSDIDANQKETLKNLITFVYDWISSHILKSDMAYKEFLKNRGVE